MKEYKVVETEKEIRAAYDALCDLAEKRGIRIFAIIGEAVLPEKAAVFMDNPRSCKLKEVSHRMQAYDSLRRVWVRAYAKRLAELGIPTLEDIIGDDDDGED